MTRHSTWGVAVSLTGTWTPLFHSCLQGSDIMKHRLTSKNVSFSFTFIAVIKSVRKSSASFPPCPFSLLLCQLWSCLFILESFDVDGRSSQSESASFCPSSFLWRLSTSTSFRPSPFLVWPSTSEGFRTPYFLGRPRFRTA